MNTHTTAKKPALRTGVRFGIQVKVKRLSETDEWRARIYRDGRAYEPADCFETEKSWAIRAMHDMFRHEIARRRVQLGFASATLERLAGLQEVDA